MVVIQHQWQWWHGIISGDSAYQLVDLNHLSLLYHFIQFGRPHDAWQSCQNFGFGNLPNLPWHVKIFSSLVLQVKNFYIWHVITKWIRHLTKIAVTTMTFQCFEGPLWCMTAKLMKWYSIPASSTCHPLARVLRWLILIPTHHLGWCLPCKGVGRCLKWNVNGCHESGDPRSGDMFGRGINIALNLEHLNQT